MRIIFYVMSFLMFVTAASAETRDIKVKSGKKTAVHGMAIYNETHCGYAQLPAVSVPNKPKHGKITWVKGWQKLNKGAGHCAGKRVKSIVVYYQPKRGYRGQDKFKVRYKWARFNLAPTQSSSDTNFNVTVK